jgi:DNA helicase II / ATP-dependent DNA helicase PcrA
MDILAGLNPAQKQAVEAINGPVLILAGPGSGKTRVITHRIAYLIRVVGVNPRRILAVTFTNKAAREMEDRLGKLVSASVKDITLGTFHAICARILRVDGKAIGIDPKFVIYDDDDQVSLVKRALTELNLDPKQFAPRALLSSISSAKAAMQRPEDISGRSYFEEVTQRVYERYQKLLEASSALDFDDLLMKTVILFQKSPETLKRYQARYLHIQVDEFQDTNLVQYELVKLLAAQYRNVCVVGDPDQSIYSWRSADIRNILNFEKDFPDAKVVLLEQNYRSTQVILDAASHVIAANKERKAKGLWTENEKGEPACVIETYSEEEEAQYVVNEIDKLIRNEKMKSGDFAVLYRTNAQSRVLEEAFIRYGMPYKLVAGTRFYERREVKDIIAYCRLIQNPNDTVSLMRVINVPQRGIGDKSLDELAVWARGQGLNEYAALKLMAESKESNFQVPFSARTTKALAGFAVMLEDLIQKSRELQLVQLFDAIVEKSGYKQYIMAMPDGEDRWENILELRGVAQDYKDLPPEQGMAGFLESVALVSDVDSLPDKLDTVTLITLHQAKGLEFPVVFMVGMEDGILPHYRSIDDPAQLEEERRLCYVGITRAQKRVYLVRAFRRHLMGANQVNKPSRFLKDIPKELVASAATAKEDDWTAGGTTTLAANKAEADRKYGIARSDILELKAGDHVKHAQFGEGIVINYHKVKNDAEAVVAFEGAGVKRFLMSFAKIEKV